MWCDNEDSLCISLSIAYALSCCLSLCRESVVLGNIKTISAFSRPKVMVRGACLKKNPFKNV